jgi:hypothetical protein
MNEYKLKLTSAPFDSKIDSSLSLFLLQLVRMERMIDSFSLHQQLPRIATNQRKRKKDRKKKIKIHYSFCPSESAIIAV